MAEKTMLNDLIANRWSPRNFSARPVDPAALESLFEASRWAASCYNEQPWRFIVATKAQPEEFARVLKLLVPQNRAWAESAWALGISAGKKTFTHNGTPDRFGLHDAGAALANLMLQATAIGLHVHAMGGFDPAGTRSEFAIPDDFEVGAAFAIGYVDGGDAPPAERSRRPLQEIVFSGGWERPAFGR